jgi:capsular polysaccharide biosynthesis protein
MPPFGRSADPWQAVDGGPDGDGHIGTGVAGDRATDGEVSRLGVLWRAKFAIAGATVVVGALVYTASSLMTPVYSSSTTIVVTAASTPGGSAQDVALASNDLAAQDAQLVTADAVISAAAAQLHVSGSTLSSHVSAGTVNAQNVIQVTAQSSGRAAAQQWADAIARDFQAYLVMRAQANSQALRNAVDQQAAPLDQQIAQLQSDIAKAPPAAPGTEALSTVQSMEGQLTQLMASRATLEENTALAIASQNPNISIPTAAGTATKLDPRPSLYALVAMILTVLVGSQIAIVLARRRQGQDQP